MKIVHSAVFFTLEIEKKMCENNFSNVPALAFFYQADYSIQRIWKNILIIYFCINPYGAPCICIEELTALHVAH